MATAKVTLLIDLKSRLNALNKTIGRFQALGRTIQSTFLPLAGAAGVAAGLARAHREGVAGKQWASARDT